MNVDEKKGEQSPILQAFSNANITILGKMDPEGNYTVFKKNNDIRRIFKHGDVHICITFSNEAYILSDDGENWLPMHEVLDFKLKEG